MSEDVVPYIDPDNPPRIGFNYWEALLFVETPEQAIAYCEAEGLPVPTECPKFGSSLLMRRFVSKLRESCSLYIVVPPQLRLPKGRACNLQRDYLGGWLKLKTVPIQACFLIRRIVVLADGQSYILRRKN